MQHLRSKVQELCESASVEPETERHGDSCASAIDVSAGVDLGRSGQGQNKASELDDDRQECVFCFCSPSVTRVGSSGWAMGRMLTREIPGSGRNCTGNFGP